MRAPHEHDLGEPSAGTPCRSPGGERTSGAWRREARDERAQPPSPQDLLLASPTTIDHIGRVVASVMIDGKGPFRFIIDTGANRCTISPQLAAILGLRPSLRLAMHVTGVTGSANVASVPIEKLQAGDLVISDTRFPVISSPIMEGADGILGAAGLQDERLLVDFRHNRVIITRSAR